MNKKTRNIIIYGLLGLVVLLVLFYKLLPADTIVGIAGRNNVVSNTLCTVPVRVSGRSMEPFLRAGEKANLTKCFEYSEIEESTVVMFKDNSTKRLAVVKSVKGNTIQLFQPNRADRVIADITVEDVIAIYNEKYMGEVPEN